MTVANQVGGPCATCILRSSNFCGTLLHPSGEQEEQHGLRQVFAGASANQTIYHRNETSEDVYVLCYGWATCLVQLSDGRKQILSILLAGDLFSSKMIFTNALHFSVQALTDVRLSRINRADLKAKLFSNPAKLDALGKICMAEGKAADDLLVDLGRRTADERIAHLILSLTERISRRTVIRDGRYPFPLRQQDIADTLGLTPEHVSRVVTKFRNAKLFEFSAGFLQIHNAGELERIGRPR
jgi:CRP-like cAMP-binding protein